MMNCPRCNSTLVRTTDASNEPPNHFKCVDCHLYWTRLTPEQEAAARTQLPNACYHSIQAGVVCAPCAFEAVYKVLALQQAEVQAVNDPEYPKGLRDFLLE